MIQDDDAQSSPAAFDWKAAQLVHRDCLPHVRQNNVVYFVTFRLADSLPAERVRQLRAQRDRWLATNPLPHTPAQAKTFRELWTARLENLMDDGHGECLLRKPDCRQIVNLVLRHNDGTLYRLGDFVIMPNHVHALVQALPAGDLSTILKAWKSVSARRINQALKRSGSVWQEEYFDHIVRDTSALNRFTNYIQQNPRNLPANTFTLGRGTLQA